MSALLLLCGLGALAHADTQFVSAPIITPLDSNNPWCPGGLVQISITVRNTTNNDEEGRINIALSTSTYTSWASLPNSVNANVWHYAKDGAGTGSVATPLSGSNDNNYPNGGYKAFVPAAAYHMANATVVFTLQLPTTMVYGAPMYFHFASNAYYVGVAQNPGQGSISPSQPFSACTPSGGSSFVGKRAEGTMNNGEIMLYWLDYDFINSTNNQVRDQIPACMSILSAQPQPYNGSAATITGNLVQWRVADATSASTPTAYREKGALWVLVSVNTCTTGVDVCNTGEFTSSFFGSAWQATNDACQRVGGVNVTLYKRQYDASYTPITSANDGQTVNYVLNYSLSGSGLRCFDSFNTYANGSYNSNAFPGGLWTKDPDSNGSDTWAINSLPTGEKYIQYTNNQSTYRILRYSCPTAAINGGEDICGNMMIEADVRIDGNAANGDTGLVIRNNGISGATTGGDDGARGYMIILSVDSQGGGNVQNLQLQRNVDPFNSGTAWPAGGGYTTGLAAAPKQGVWYTIKALEQPAGNFRIKFWERGTPEPAWQITFDDSVYMAANNMGCGTAGDGRVWKPGIAGQNDLMSYDNFRVYGAAALTNAKIWDTIPVGVDYQSAAPAPNGLTPSGTGANEGMIRWDFTTGNFGATAVNTLYEGSGSFTWTGRVDCTEAGIVNNTANIGASELPVSQDSNTTTLTIASCGTPTSTRTPTSTVTLTPTRTNTPTATLTFTPTATRTDTPTSTFTFTATLTFTPTATRTNTPSPTDTFTPTPTRTPSATPTDTNTLGPTPTFTLTATPTFTRTDSPTFTHTFTHTPSRTPTATPSGTPSVTPTITITTPYSPTNTPTVTHTSTITFTSTQTVTFSPTQTWTDTATPTPSATQTVTFTNTATRTDSPTPSASATQSVTFTDSPTRTLTATPTGTRTLTPTRTVTFSFTVSPTITETPVPVPHQIKISAYNEAGELVKLIFEGAAQYKPGDINLDQDVVAGGAGGVSISIPGYLYDPSLGSTLTSVLWLADNNDGQLVKGGIYTIKAEIIDQFGQVTTLQKPVQVVSVTPRNELLIFNGAGEVVARPALPLPPSGRAYTNVTLKTESFSPEYLSGTAALMVFEVRDETGYITTVTWDGLNERGVPVNSGSYTAQLIYSASGTTASSVIETKGFVVLRGSTPGDLSSVIAGPNPALRGEDLQIKYTPSAGYTAVARLFSLAGELVEQTEDSGQTGWMVLATKGRSPGIYFLKVENTYGSAVVNRVVRKICIVR